MATSANQPIDESLVNIYEEHFLRHADTVYRFAFALTLSLDGASQCVRETYKVIAANLAKYADTAEGGAHSMTKALQPLAISARAALVAIDVAGLDAVSAARVLQMSDKDLRVHLAHARRTLLSSGAQL